MNNRTVGARMGLVLALAFAASIPSRPAFAAASDSVATASDSVATEPPPPAPSKRARLSAPT